MNAAIHPSGCFESERSIGILHFTDLLFRVQQFISLETGRNRPRGPVFMKAESSQFIGDQQRVDTWHLILVTKGYTIIKCTKTKSQFHISGIFQKNRHFIIMIPVRFILSPRLRPDLVFIGKDSVHHTKSPIKIDSVFRFETERRVIQ